MPTCKEFGLLVALGLIVTVVVFPLGFFASRALWPTSSQSGEADPLRELNAKYKGLFMTRTEIFKMNWCEANRTHCPDGTFPTEGLEADVVRNHSAAYDALNVSSVALNETEDWYRPRKMGTLIAAIKGDNDRCCQTWNTLKIMFGWKKIYPNGPSCFIPTLDYSYQVVFVGECNENRSSAGCTQVNGKCCKTKKRPVSLPCVTTEGYHVFRWFPVDAYCSCQSTCLGV